MNNILRLYVVRNIGAGYQEECCSNVELNIARDVVRKVRRSLTLGGFLDDSPTIVV